MMLLLFDTGLHHQNAVEQAVDDDVHEKDGTYLCCRNCRHKIVNSRSVILVDGKSQHHYTNPFGVQFQFHCYSDAPGCEVSGAPTLEHTWFSGCHWQYASCRQCHTHLGWYFSGVKVFFGLILDKLVQCNETE